MRAETLLSNGLGRAACVVGERRAEFDGRDGSRVLLLHRARSRARHSDRRSHQGALVAGGISRDRARLELANRSVRVPGGRGISVSPARAAPRLRRDLGRMVTKDTSSATSPAHRSLPPLSSPATDLLSRAQIKCCLKLLPIASQQREDRRTDIETSRTVLKTLLFDLMTHDDHSLKFSFLVAINKLKQAMFSDKSTLAIIRADKVSHNETPKMH